MHDAAAMIYGARFVFASLLVMLVGACAARAATVAPSTTPVDISCRTDADCAVKDVGNCCGYYPACVNRESKVFPERVKAECARKNMEGVCGFPQIDACTCNAGRCAAQTGPVERQ